MTYATEDIRQLLKRGEHIGLVSVFTFVDQLNGLLHISVARLEQGEHLLDSVASDDCFVFQSETDGFLGFAF